MASEMMRKKARKGRDIFLSMAKHGQVTETPVYSAKKALALAPPSVEVDHDVPPFASGFGSISLMVSK